MIQAGKLICSNWFGEIFPSLLSRIAQSGGNATTRPSSELRGVGGVSDVDPAATEDVAFAQRFESGTHRLKKKKHTVWMSQF